MLGHTRLVLTGVFAELDRELPWIADAVPGASTTAVRLTADLPTCRPFESTAGKSAVLRRTSSPAPPGNVPPSPGPDHKARH